MEINTLTKPTIGRPLQWKDPQVLQGLIEDYWAECKERGVQFTIAGLAVALYVDRKTITNYAHKDAFFPIIKRARNIVNAKLEEHLMSGKPPIGAIFLGKNNFGYTDKTEIEHSGKVGIGRVVDRLESNQNVIEGQYVEDVEMIEGDSEDEEMAQ